MDDIIVEFLGGETVPARIISSEPAADLSMIQLTRVPAGAPVARLGDSDGVHVGQQVLVIGAPYGLSLQCGLDQRQVVAQHGVPCDAARRILPDNGHDQHGEFGRPPVQHGRRGSRHRESQCLQRRGSEGLGFAVTMKSVRYFLMEREWAWVGLEGTVVTGELAEIFNIPGGSGLLLSVVPKGSPAWDMGLQGGDRIATIGGREIVVRGDIVLTMAGIVVRSEADIPRIREKIGAMATGELFKASVLRAGEVIELTGKAP